MAIRIKGKQLVYTGILLFVIILSITFLGGHLLYQYANVLQKMGYTEKANVYYSRIADRYAKNNSGILAEYKRVQNILIEGNFKYSSCFTGISAGSISNSGFIGYKTVDSVNARYETLKKNKRASQSILGEYTMAVALVNWFGGRADRAVELLEASNFQQERLQELRNLHLSNMYFFLGEAEKSRMVIEGMKPLDGLEGYQEDIRVLNAFFEKRGEITYKKPMLYEYKPNADCLEEPLKFMRSYTNSLNTFAANSSESLKGNTLSGRITLDGIPQQNLMVFIKDALYENTWSSMTGKGDGLVGMGISDHEGNFVIANIPDGVYGMVMYFPWQRISGKNIDYHAEFDIVLNRSTQRTENIALSSPFQVKVTQKDDQIIFRWNENELPQGPYSLAISELTEKDGMLYRSNNTLYIRTLKGNELTVDIPQTREKAYRLGFSYGGKPDPIEYLEPLYHSGKYGYTLYSTGSTGMLHFTSEGIYPNHQPNGFTIRGCDWTDEDRLLLDGKFDEARKAYEALLEKEPENIHALKVLSRMYDFGYIASSEEHSMDALGGKDEPRALELLQRLDSLVDSNDIKSALADQYGELQRYAEAVELLQFLQNRDPSPYTNQEIGRNYLYMNQFAESVKYFQSFTRETELVTLNLLLPAILINDSELLSVSFVHSEKVMVPDISNLVEKYIRMDKNAYADFYEFMRRGQVQEAQTWLQERDGEMDAFLKAVFLLTRDPGRMSYEKRENAFRELHMKVHNPVLDELLVYLGRELLVSNYRTPLD